jgi:hypothetical protein
MGLARLTALSRAVRTLPLRTGTIICRAFARQMMVGGDGFEPPTLSV